MLQKIRTHTHGWLAWVLIATLAFVFILWGIAGELITSPGEKAVAEVAGKPITTAELQTVYERLAQQSQMAQIMAGIHSPMVNEQQIRKQALDSLVIERVLSTAAQEQGFMVTPDQVNGILIKLPQFQANGEFSPALYERIVRQMNFTPQSFRDTVQKEMLITQAQSTIRDSVFLLPYQFQEAVDLVNQTRDVEYAVFKADTFANEVKITPEELKAYYDSHQSEFMTDETVKVAYVVLDKTALTEKLKQNLKPTDEQLHEYYQDNIGRFSSAELRTAKHILIAVKPTATQAELDAAKTKAESILAELKRGANFADLAKKDSDDPSSAALGGDLGAFGHGEMVPEFENAVFNGKEGDLVGPVKTDFGYHIILIGKTQPAVVKPLEQVKAQLTKEWLDDKIIEQYDKELGEIDQMAFENTDSLDKVSQTFGLPLQTMTMSKEIEKNTDLGKIPQVHEAAFSDDVLFSRQNSEMIRIQPDKAIILRDTEHQTPTLKPFDEVKDSLKTTLINRQGLFLAREKTNKILEAYKNGDDLAKLAQQENFSWTSVKNLSRQNNQDLPREVLEAAFKQPQSGKPAMIGAQMDGNASALVVITAIHPGKIDPQFAKAMTEEFTASLQQFKGIRDFNFYVTAAKEKAKVEMRD